ncbi:ATPase inhibitor subunit zeta [Hirschia litorea]|uniref:ATPase inhibitor subunit zeta n=1 Tax=Hirschia litorea TaxID=1199156 RepID=A0ABW2IL52_9PROT
MKQFQARARAEEAVYANKQTSEFLIQARGLRQLGEWAAKELMGENTPGVAIYAEALVRSGIAGSDAFKVVEDDLRLAGHAESSAQVPTRFQEYLEQARNLNA